jgi:peptide/nickel transport system substrate-binding protein
MRVEFPRRTAVTLATVCLVAATCARQGTEPVQAPEGGGVVRVVMADQANAGFDPQVSWSNTQFEVLRCCLARTLMTYPGLPDFEGNQPVPDLAAGPPDVSEDGMTWTFHLRSGIHYAPPLADVEVTAADVVRALLRAGSPDAEDGPGRALLPLIEGFEEYANGEANAIAGVATPDPSTLQVRTTRPDRTVAHLFSLPLTSPIPAKPDDPTAVFGVATGHPFVPQEEIGYGPFLVATGPYMIEGADALDPGAPPDEQVPVAGLASEDPGSLTLVRNPSWDPATDPNRPALADRIEIDIAPDQDPYATLQEGGTDVVIGLDPPARMVERYRSDASLRDRIDVVDAAASQFAAMNLGVPPFDDVHVRRAVALILDKPALAQNEGEPVATHLLPEPMIGSLLSGWSASPEADQSGDVRAARAEMDASRYGRDGRCVDKVCDGVPVLFLADDPDIASSVRDSLASIGIRMREADEFCGDPNSHVALCVGGWGADYPDASNMIAPFLANSGYTPTLLGSSPEQLAEWGYAEGTEIPSVQADYERCVAMSGVPAAMCWARLDQLLTGPLAALVPIAYFVTVRIRGANVTSYSIDQAWGEPSLDRIAVG